MSDALLYHMLKRFCDDKTQVSIRPVGYPFSPYKGTITEVGTDYIRVLTSRKKVLFININYIESVMID